MKLSKKQRKELNALLADDRLLEAAERYQEMTGAGSDEASAAIEELQAGSPGATGPDAAARERAESAAMVAVSRDQMADAIVRYRRHSKASLSDARRAVEALALAHRSDGRIRPKLAETLIGLVAADQKEAAVTQLVSGAGFEEIEARKFVARMERFAPAPPPGRMQLVRVAAAVGLLIAFILFLLLTGQL